MSDGEAATGRINEVLAERNEELEKELAEMRALLGRPLNVNVQSANQDVLKKIGDYLPQLTHLSTNVAEVGGKLVQANALTEQTNRSLGHLVSHLATIAETLDRLIPEPPEGGPEADDRYFHMEAGAPWDGRLCKKYGMAWSVVDPGDMDPLNVGDPCAASHAVWRGEA